MFNKWKDQLNDKFKKKEEGVSDSTSNQSRPQDPNAAAQAEQVTFSLNNMAEFTHEELQTVINKYDTGLKKMRGTMSERAEKISALELELSKKE